MGGVVCLPVMVIAGEGDKTNRPLIRGLFARNRSNNEQYRSEIVSIYYKFKVVSIKMDRKVFKSCNDDTPYPYIYVAKLLNNGGYVLVWVNERGFNASFVDELFIHRENMLPVTHPVEIFTTLDEAVSRIKELFSKAESVRIKIETARQV